MPDDSAPAPRPTTAGRPGRPARPARAARAVLLLTLVGVLGAAGSPAGATTSEDPNLQQTIAEDLPVVHGERVLERGHVDMGPKFVDGAWRFLIHDDVEKADPTQQSVWRYPDETVFHVVDEALLPVPDDPVYSFVGAPVGQRVWVSPQTQNPDVVWIGWNTQDPTVMQTIDRGVTLSLVGAQGPGTVTTYLQSGSFDAPQVLWDSRITDPQPVWVDVNTHTHANWVFTEPGVYLLRLEASADLLDGSRVSDVQTLRFAVGSSTSTADALAAVWSGPTPSDTDTSPSPTEATSAGSAASAASANRGQDDPLVAVLLVAIAVVAAGLLLGVVVVLVRSRRLRRQVLAQRATAPENSTGSPS